MSKTKKKTFIDLFAGCGGLSLGLEQAGFFPLYVNELNKDAMETYLINREKALVESSRALQVRETSLTTIEKSSFFQKTNEKKNCHLRKRLTNTTNLLQDKTTEVEEFKQTLSSLRQEISKLKSQNASFNARFDALRYKNDVKDRRIKELTYNNNNKGNHNETRISVSPSHRRF